MRSHLYYLCLLAVYVAASPLAEQTKVARGLAIPVLRLTRSDKVQHDTLAATPTPLVLAKGRRAIAEDEDDDDCEEEADATTVTTKVIPKTATRTKTFSVTATSTTSRTRTQYSTSTSTKTVTKKVPSSSSKATSKKTTTTKAAAIKTTSKATTTKKTSTSSKPTAAATTTLTTLVTPIPTGKNYVFKGMSSWYYTGLGACGWWSNDGEMVAAVPDHVYDNFPGATAWWDTNGNPICGNKINITWGGKTIQVTVVDRCVGCDTYQIDLSPTAFGALADGDLDKGLLYDITWQWA